MKQQHRKAIVTLAILVLIASGGRVNRTVAGFQPITTGSETEIESGHPDTWYAAANDDGAWCWFADPRGVYYEGKHRRTYLGWVRRGGDLVVGSYDHDTYQWQHAVIRPKFERDDHANPTLHVLPDGRLIVFYTAHDRTGPLMYYRIAAQPESIDTWGVEQTIADDTPGWASVCYPNVAQLSAEQNRLYLFYRGHDWKPTITTSDDEGTTWSKPAVLIEGRAGNEHNRPYCKFSHNEVDTINIAFTAGHPRNEPQNSIYFAQFKGGAFHRADGTLIKSFEDGPLAFVEAELVYDARENGARAWIWDIAQDDQGRPVMVYAVCPTEETHEYHYARFNGEEWERHKLCDAGGWFPQTPEGKTEPEPHYSGGIVLDHDDPSIAYLSREINGVFEIERLQTADGGATWDTETITSGSAANNIRPFVVRHHPADDRGLYWMNGPYVHYTNYSTLLRRDMSAADQQAVLILRQGWLTAPKTLAIMQRVCDWQLGEIEAGRVGGGAKGWVRGAFLTGLMATWRATDDSKYFDVAVAFGEANDWQLGDRLRHADDHCVGQMYAEVYEAAPDEKRIAALRQTFDQLIADPKPGREDWWWCDALFMAPPAMARLAKVTGDSRYLEFMDEMWWDCTEFLYDPDQHLYYRDSRFFDATEPNGESVFWSRGNGWVFAGMARVLQYLPQNHPHRERYETLFVDMANTLAVIQPADGLWRPSLLDPGSMPVGETSGSGFYCFGLACGINEGLLDREKFEPVVMKAFSALCAAVGPDGRLGYVQRIADRPQSTTQTSTQEYGVGAFLLAGEQVHRLLTNTP